MSDIYELKDRTVGKILTDKATRHKDKPFCYFKDEVLTYGQLNEKANMIANGFLKMQITKGSTVCVLLPNCLDYFTTFFGLAKTGAIEVPLNTAHKGNILQHMINYSDAETMVVDKELLERVGFIEQGLKNLKTLVVYPDNKDIPALRFNTISWKEMLDNPATEPSVDVSHSDTLAIMFTSGTTGVSKGVMQPHNQYIWAGEEIVKEARITSEDVFYTWLPLFHFTGQGLITMGTLLASASMGLVERFSVSAFWNDVKKFRATVTGGFSQMVELLFNQPAKSEDAENTVRVMVVGLVPKAIHRAFEKRFNVVLLDDYGMSEAEPISYAAYEDRRPGSCGQCVEDFEVKIFDDDDNEVAPNVAGEIVVRPLKPYIMMTGYYKMPDKTLETWRNLWFHTGDFAYKDAEGYIYFIDRVKDYIRRRAENISSSELESIINSHPKVMESAAVGVPSEFGEDDVKVVVRLKEGEILSPQELLAFCEDRMAYFMVPRYVEFVDRLPMTETEKVKKLELKSLTEKTWDREKAGYKIRRR